MANADEKDVQYLFYASNMSDPLNSSDEVFKKYDIVTKMYNELSKKSQQKIDNQIANLNGIDINKNKLVIIRIPFFGEFDEKNINLFFKQQKKYLVLWVIILSTKVILLSVKWNQNLIIMERIKKKM